MAGARAGLSGARSGLFMEQIRIMREMRTAGESNGAGPAPTSVPAGCAGRMFQARSAADRPKGEDFRIVLEEIVRIDDIGAEVPQILSLFVAGRGETP